MTDPVSDHGIRLLRELGLNQLEAEVYVFLVPNEPMTGYRIGKHLGRPTANVYKAIDALARRGAVLVEEGESRACRAVPVDEFLRFSRRHYERITGEVKHALSSLQAEAFDERVYRLEAVPAVLEKAVSMLRNAREVAVIDAFPGILERLRAPIEAAIRREVEVFIEAYAEIEIAGARIAHVPHAERSLAAWRCEQLNLVVDGKELLVALLDSDLSRVHQAAWSRSLYLACLLHSGRLCEQTVVRMRGALDADPSGAQLAEILSQHRFFRDSDVPGHREITDRFVTRSPS